MQEGDDFNGLGIFAIAVIANALLYLALVLISK
jgi:hypothetical protein